MVDVDAMLLADAAVVAEGKLYIHGAAWDMISAAAFPITQPSLTLAVLLRVPWNDTNQQHMLELDIVNADSVSILSNPPGPMRGPMTVGRPPHIPQGQDILVPLVFNFVGIRFEQPGEYAVIMRIQGLERKRFPFHLLSLGA